jgi:hypothetical protein
MELDYRTASTDSQSAEVGFCVVVLWFLISYLVVCAITIPFVDRLWFGEVPVLAIVQWPKTAMANWVRVEVVMKLSRWIGWSSGSFSTDYGLARPYALAIAYLVPLTIVVAVMGWRTKLQPPLRRLVWMLAAVVSVDYLMTLLFADGPGLSIY